MPSVTFNVTGSDGKTYPVTDPTGAEESLDLVKKILLDCAESIPTVVTVPTQAITKDNAAQFLKEPEASSYVSTWECDKLWSRSTGAAP